VCSEKVLVLEDDDLDQLLTWQWPRATLNLVVGKNLLD